MDVFNFPNHNLPGSLKLAFLPDKSLLVHLHVFQAVPPDHWLLLLIINVIPTCSFTVVLKLWGVDHQGKYLFNVNVKKDKIVLFLNLFCKIGEQL